MLIMFVRAALLYLLAVLSMRVMGKRQIGQLQPFELVVVIIIAELAATPLEDTGKPILYGVIPMIALIVCHSFLSVLIMRSQRARAMLCGQPTVLIRGGALCEKQMRKMSVTLNDLMEELRLCGMQDLSQVETAVLETGGTISVFPKAADRPLTPRDMGMQPPEEELPLPLILDGTVQPDNLERAGHDGAWLKSIVHQLGYQHEKDVFFLCINSRRLIICQGRGKTSMQQLQEGA